MADVGAISATVLYTAAILMLLGVRSWRQHRITGTAGFNGFRGAKTAATRVAGAGFVLALLTGVVSPVLVCLHTLPLLWADSRWASALTVGGALLGLAGVVLAFAAQSEMGTSWRIGVDTSERTELVTHGLFAVTRNPIFTALLLIQIGTAAMAPTWMVILGVASLLLACQVQVRLVEEPYLMAMHKVSYPSYASRAGRFLPVLGRLHHAHHSPANRRTQHGAGETNPSDGHPGVAGR